MEKYNLQRFIDAQSRVYDTVLSELNAGYKRTHWIWYIFPQIQGLGRSSTAQYYAILDINEAKAFLNHSILRKRLIECTSIVAQQQVVFPYPDDMKLKSSMTLFSQVSDNTLFISVLEQYFGGEPDQRTLGIINNV